MNLALFLPALALLPFAAAALLMLVTN